MPYGGGSTNTPAALDMTTGIFSGTIGQGKRPGARNMVFVLHVGPTDVNAGSLGTTATALHALAEVYAIGIGSNLAELPVIGTDPAANVVEVEDFAALESITIEVVDFLCKCQA